MPTYGTINLVPSYPPHLAPPGLILRAKKLITIAVIIAADVTSGTFSEMLIKPY